MSYNLATFGIKSTTKSFSVTKPHVHNKSASHDNDNLFFLESNAYNPGAGLGHNFMHLNHFVTFANEHNLSIRTAFQTTGHGLNRTDTRAYFFGEEIMTPLPKNRNCSRVQTDFEMVPQLVFRERTNRSSCVVFTVGLLKTNTIGLDTNLPYFRQLFQRNDAVRRTIIQENPVDKSQSAPIRVAVHIRRGDLRGFTGSENAARGRLVHENMYVVILNQLLKKLRQHGKNDVVIRLYCEGMKAPSSIPRASDWTFFNLSDEVNFYPSQNVKIDAGPNGALQAFDEMCLSDILVTGPSGFSFLVSYLCSAPIVLAVPFWQSYGYIPNALSLEINRSSIPLPGLGVKSADLIFTASFNESRFDLLWHKKKIHKRFSSDS